MTIEEEIFKKYKIDFLKLVEYGFKNEKNNYLFKKKINDDFLAIIEIDLDNHVKGTIMDLTTNLEYSNFRLTNPGPYALKIKNEYELLLKDIANSCGSLKYFIFDQTNRIAKYIVDKYDIEPVYLFKSTPDCGVFKNSKNKWFGIVMQIDKSKLMDGHGLVEVMNIKVNDLVSELIKREGYYPAYHMSKQKWLSIVLDDTLKDEEIIKYIDISYELVK